MLLVFLAMASDKVGEGYTADSVEPTPAVEEATPVSSDVESDGSSSGAEETESEQSEKSKKTNDDRSDVGGDDDKDPEAGASTTPEIITIPLDTAIAKNLKVVENLLKDKISAASSSSEFNEAIVVSRACAKMFFDIYTDATEKQRQMKKKEEKKVKKDKEREERMAPLTLNIMTDVPSGTIQTLTIAGNDTIGQLRILIGATFFEELSKKKVKGMRLMLGDNDITETTGKLRKNVRNVLQSGETVKVFFGGAGGGKRGASAMSGKCSRGDKIVELKENLTMAKLRAQTSPIQVVNGAMAEVMNALTLIEADHMNAMATALAPLTVAQLKKMQVGCMNGSPDYKVSTISKTLFQQSITQFEEYKKQFILVENAMRDVIAILMLSNYGQEENTTIAWQSFISHLADNIEKSAKSIPATVPPADDPMGGKGGGKGAK